MFFLLHIPPPPVTRHAAVSLALPDGDGTGHVLSVAVGGQIVSATTGWQQPSDQCNKGKGLDNRFGWFDYDPPRITDIAPPTVATSGNISITIEGTNFGVSPPTVTVYNRKLVTTTTTNSNGETSTTTSSTCDCEVMLKQRCLAGFACTASHCCDATPETLGCGCYGPSCRCCTEMSTCTVTYATHDSITCVLAPGQGLDLEMTVAVQGQSSAEGGPPVLFSYLPPTIDAIDAMTANTTGGTMVTVTGSSFGLRGATIDLLGDGQIPGNPLSENIGPIEAVFQNHTTVMFRVPEGHGTHRRVRLTVGGQSTTYTKEYFHYQSPVFTALKQPTPCTTRVRTTACGSPTQGGFKMTLFGINLGTMSTSSLTVTLGNNKNTQCCLANKAMTGQDDCNTVGSAASLACACCVETHTHDAITIRTASGVGKHVPLHVDFGGYRGWGHSTVYHYDAPYINFINPQMGNANGGQVNLHGINFGDVFNGGNVSKITIGNVSCTNIQWVGTGSTDEAVSCTIGKATAGPKTVSMTVEDQTNTWLDQEWLNGNSGHRLYFANCPPSYYGRVGEPCFECAYVTDNDGKTVMDNRGEKQYMATCSGGEREPVAKQGFYRTMIHKQCGTDSSMSCTNSSQCNKGVVCSWDHVVGKEYCNSSLRALRTSCGYILSCEPSEACNANNKCSLIPDGTVDPVTGKERDPHGYANTTMAGVSVERCSECASGYFRVGGRCEICPTDILLLAVLFLCGIVFLAVAGYVMHIFKVNLAMAAIGIDYAQVMSMFLKSEIRWPAPIRSLFRIMSSFNFDLVRPGALLLCCSGGF